MLKYNLPIVMCGKYCLGQLQDFQYLVDSDVLESIIDEGKLFYLKSNLEYYKRCLLCNTIKLEPNFDDDQVCSSCGHKYTFFHLKY